MIFKFKNKSAEDLENRLNKLVDKYQEDLGLRDTLENKIENAKINAVLGKVVGFGLGTATVVGGVVAMFAMSNISTVDGVNMLTISGTAVNTMVAGGAIMVAGLGYSGISNLYKMYQESKLGKGLEKDFEFYRKDRLLTEMSEKFSKVVEKSTDKEHTMDHRKVRKIEEYLIANDIDAARDVIKEVVSKVNIKENKEDSKIKNKL